MSFLLTCQTAFLAYASFDVETKYPIVLIHGLLGYGNKISIMADYWGDIPDILSAHGARVHVADVSQAHKIEKRGEQLYAQLKKLGHRRYHLIGHSQGGLDARYVLENYPEVVASVTTIGSPHYGSKVADYLVEKISHNLFFNAFAYIAGNLLGHFLGIMSGNLHEQNIVSALKGLTTDAMEKFNAQYPHGLSNTYCGDGPPEYRGRRLYSWGSYGAEPYKGSDIVGKILAKTSKLFDIPNDGLVDICSMRFGTWLGESEGGHHLMPVGGVVSPVSDEHRQWSSMMFLRHAQRLKYQGL